MAGKAGRSGRRKSDVVMLTVATRLPQSEYDALEQYVRRKSMETLGNPDALAMAAVVRGLIKAVVDPGRADDAPPDPRPASKPRKNRST